MVQRRYQKVHSRSQAMLLPECLDDYVSEHNSVRSIDAFVDTLDVQELGFEHAQANSGTGQPAFDPALLLKLYLTVSHCPRSLRCRTSGGLTAWRRHQELGANPGIRSSCFFSAAANSSQPLGKPGIRRIRCHDGAPKASGRATDPRFPGPEAVVLPPSTGHGGDQPPRIQRQAHQAPDRVDPGLLSAFAAKGHMALNAPFLQSGEGFLAAIAGIGQHRVRGRARRCLDPVQHRIELSLVVCLLADLGRHDHLVVGIHHDLRIVALLETLGTGLHDPTLRVGEVFLCLGLRLSVRALVRRPALGAPVGTELPPAGRVGRALARLKPGPGFPDRLKPALAPGDLFRNVLRVRAKGRVLRGVDFTGPRQQRRDLGLQPRFLFPHPRIAHRLVPARVRPHLGPINGHRAETDNARLPGQLHHRNEQMLEVAKMPAPEFAERPVARERAAAQQPERHILMQLARNPP